jgi:hypothetical protein
MLIHAIKMIEIGYGADLSIFIEGFLTTSLILLQIIGFLYFLIQALIHYKVGMRKQ